MVDSVVFFFYDSSEYNGIDPNELKALADGFNQQLVETLKDKYPIVTEPGIDVLRIRFAITDLKQSHPGLSAISTVVPARNVRISGPEEHAGGSEPGNA